MRPLKVPPRHRSALGALHTARANMLEDLADLRCLHGLTTNTEVRAFLEQEISKLVLASPSSPDDAPAVERAGWTLPAQPSPSTSAPAAAPAAAPAKKGAATGAGKEAAAADDSEGGDSEDGAASDPDEVRVRVRVRVRATAPFAGSSALTLTRARALTPTRCSCSRSGSRSGCAGCGRRAG